MMELFWTPEAINDRDAIYDYIEADNPTAALALDELFEEKAGRLLDHPGLGRPGRIAGTRELVAHQNMTCQVIYCAFCVSFMLPDSGHRYEDEWWLIPSRNPQNCGLRTGRRLLRLKKLG